MTKPISYTNDESLQRAHVQRARAVVATSRVHLLTSHHAYTPFVRQPCHRWHILMLDGQATVTQEVFLCILLLL